jgi:hypothetical protein
MNLRNRLLVFCGEHGGGDMMLRAEKNMMPCNEHGGNGRD